MLELWNTFVYVGITIIFSFLIGILTLTFAEVLVIKIRKILGRS